MKKIKKISIVAIFGALYMSLQTFAQFEKEPDIFAIQTNIEQLLNFQDAELSTQLPFDLMQKALEKYCPTSSIKDSKANLEKALSTRSQNIRENRTPVQIPLDYKKLVQQAQKIPQHNHESFCMQKYFLISILKQTHQDFFLSKLPNTTTAPKENNKQTNNTFHQTSMVTKERLNTSKLKEKDEESALEHFSAPQLKIKNNTLLTSTPEQLARTLENQIYVTLVELLNNNILNNQDISILDGKIEITYTPTCQKNKGSFHATIEKATKKTSFKAIKLLISTCPPLPNTHQIRKQINYLLIHEIGHYISFFKDNNRENFIAICRLNQKSHCSAQDFPSPYAQTHYEEDYAESFAYRYQEKKSTSQKEKEFGSAPSSQAFFLKYQHFEKLF